MDSDTWRVLFGEEVFKWGFLLGVIVFDESKILEVVDKVFLVEVFVVEVVIANSKYVMAEEDYVSDDYDFFGYDDEWGVF